MRGEVLQPGDENYEGARKLWNGVINEYLLPS